MKEPALLFRVHYSDGRIKQHQDIHWFAQHRHMFHGNCRAGVSQSVSPRHSGNEHPRFGGPADHIFPQLPSLSKGVKKDLSPPAASVEPCTRDSQVQVRTSTPSDIACFTSQRLSLQDTLKCV